MGSAMLCGARGLLPTTRTGVRTATRGDAGLRATDCVNSGTQHGRNADTDGPLGAVRHPSLDFLLGVFVNLLARIGLRFGQLTIETGELVLDLHELGLLPSQLGRIPSELVHDRRVGRRPRVEVEDLLGQHLDVLLHPRARGLKPRDTGILKVILNAHLRLESVEGGEGRVLGRADTARALGSNLTQRGQQESHGEETNEETHGNTSGTGLCGNPRVHLYLQAP